MNDFSPEGAAPHIKRGPGRPPRAEQTKQDRRRRQDTGSTAGLKLYVHPEAKDPNYEYRIINDTPGRLHSKTVLDDWDIVSLDQMNGKADPGRQFGDGTQVAFLAGKSKEGDAQRAFLCRKPKHLYEQDKAQEQRERVDAVEESMLKRPVTDSQGRGLKAGESYVPAGNSIRHGS